MTPRLAASELHIRRLPVAEALYLLERFLNAAFLAGHPRVRIVHGKGSGAVRRAVWEVLAGHPLVRGYDLALPGAGDTGVTVVEMELLPAAYRYVRDGLHSSTWPSALAWRFPTGEEGAPRGP